MATATTLRQPKQAGTARIRSFPWPFTVNVIYGAFSGMSHQPVLLQEVLRLLAPRNEGRYLDTTFGGGGHCRAILEAAPGATLHAIDRDPEAGERASALRAETEGNLSFFEGNYEALDSLLPDGLYDGILFDLGVSSFQLEDAERGFSFKLGGPLDMRMNPGQGLSAAEWIRTAGREQLIEAVRDFGEEREWRRVVDAIMRAREEGVLETTEDLVRVVEGAKVRRPRRSGPGLHPATLTFQGIRIAVNDELGGLRRALPRAFERLAPEGVLAVISFHSLEDRLVKRLFRRLCGEPEHAGDSVPQQFRSRRAGALARRPITPTDQEIARNPRSRSAKLRALKRLSPDEEIKN